MALPFSCFHTWLNWSSPQPQSNPNPSTPASFPSSNPNPGFPVSSSDSYAALDGVDSFQLRRNQRGKKPKGATTDGNGRKEAYCNNTTGPRKVQRGRRRNRSLDLDFDMVLVQPDYFSGSESEGSDWSVGWFEPHAPEFCSDTDQENSFAVLVPCYGAMPSRGGKGSFEQDDNTGPQSNSKSQLWAAVLSNLAKDSHADTNFYLQQWVSSLQT